MILDAFTRALSQMGDPRFRGVLLKGIGLTVGLLILIYWLVFQLVGWLAPDTISLPWIGEITWVDTFLSGASLILMMGLSVFLMVPVASAFTSIFLDDVTDAVEERHYPHLPPAPHVSMAEGLKDGLLFLGVIAAANILALVVYLPLLLLMPPLAPAVFIALNGYLLGREYFQLIALRRLGRAGAKQARRRHAAHIWIAGALMAAPLTIPLVNLLIPVLGAATFTHLYHRLQGEGPGRSPDFQG